MRTNGSVPFRDLGTWAVPWPRNRASCVTSGRQVSLFPPAFLVTLLRVSSDWWSYFARTMHFSACGRTKNKGTKTIDLSMKQLSPLPACHCNYRLRLFAKRVCSDQRQRKREDVEWWTQNVVYKAFPLAPIAIRQSCVAKEN